MHLALALPVAVIGRLWLRPDLAWERLPDGPNHLVRAFLFDAALGRGDWLPRWLPDLYLGYGYPLFTYYAPGTYYLTSALHRAGMTVYGSVQWVGVLAAAAGALGTYLLVRSLLPERREGALLAAAAYVLAPYPFLTNLFVRGAVPEALALGALPWPLLAATRAAAGGRRWLPALALATAAVLLTHNATGLFAAGLLAAWLLCLARGWHGAPPVPARRLARIAAALLAGAGLAAFFWLPAMAETGAVRLDLARGGIYDFHRWLLDPLGRSGSVAGADYPHTRAGPFDLSAVFDYRAIGKGEAEKIGLAQGALWLLAVAGALRYRAALPAVWAVLASACWLLTTTWSSVAWERAPLLALVQFPWRLHGPLSLCIALAAGCAMPARPGRSRLMWAPGAAGLALLAGWSALPALPAPVGPQPAHDVDARNVTALETDRFGAGTTSGGEFLPRTVGWERFASGDLAGLGLYDRTYPEAGWQAGLVRVLDGPAAVTQARRAGERIRADVDAVGPAALGLHQLLFPGWRAFVDGQPVPLSAATARVPDPAAPGRFVDASLGFMVVHVPPGRHRLDVVLGPTRPQLLGGIASAATGGALLAIVVLWALGRDRGRATVAPVALAAALAALASGAAGWATTRPPGAPPTSLQASGNDLDAVAAGLGPISERQVDLGGELRRWAVLPSPATARLRLPAHAFLQMGLAAAGESTVRFVVEAESASGRATVLDREVPAGAPRWTDAWVDLEFLGGQDVRLTLRVEPPGAGAGWANLQLVTWDNPARPYPGTRHLW